MCKKIIDFKGVLTVWAIFKREIKNYLLNPIGYVFFSIFFAISGYLFYYTTFASSSSEISYFFSLLIFNLMFCVPVLTMGLFSEEYRLFTDRLLFSAPVSLASIVFGKYFCALAIYFVAIFISLIYMFVLSLFCVVSLSLLFSCFFGTFLMGAALIAVGIFVSTLSKNYVVSAFGTFGFIMLFIFIGRLGVHLPFFKLKEFFEGLAIMPRYNNFTYGILNIQDILYFLSVIFVFLFLSVSWLEKKRWS